MAFIKKIWKDRISQFPNRRTINDGNVTKQVTVGRDEGNITEEGDSFDASNMNDLEQRIEDAYGDLQGLVASEVSQQYNSANVIFDNTPTEHHGTGYTVTSEGIKTAIDSGLVHAKTVSGSIVHFEDGADNVPVKSLVSQIAAVESGNGQPKSPSNPYTISGFANGIITRCGVNLIKKQALMQPVHLASGTTIYAKLFNFSGQFNLYGLKKGLSDIPANWTALLSMGSDLRSLTLTDDYDYIGISSGAYSDLGAGDMQVSLAPFSVFSAYNGNTYTFAFGQTVYGGHFDNKGNLVLTHIMLNFSDLNFSGSNPGNHIFRGDYSGTYYSNMKFPSSVTVATEDFTEKYEAMAWQPISSSDNGKFALNDYGTLARFVFIDNNYSTQADFETARANDKIIVELANPIALSITSQDISTLFGENNIFSNTGDVELTYYADTDAIYAIRDVIDEFAMQSDWNEADNTKADYIKNKPTIPTNADFSLSGLSDTDITTPSAGQVLAFDGDDWVNTNQIVVKYEEKNITFDSTGEGTLYFANGYILGLKDIPSDSLYIGYITYMAGTKTMVKGFNRSATTFDSSSIASTTRKIGIYYLDYITTQ